jgi:hypothetical protein
MLKPPPGSFTRIIRRAVEIRGFLRLSTEDNSSIIYEYVSPYLPEPLDFNWTYRTIENTS